MGSVKEQLEKYKNLIILAVVVIVGVGGYMAIAGGGDPSLTGAPAEDSESAQIERELLDELLKLQAIELNEALFADALFLSLVDFSKPLSEQPVGRSNPFAPVGGAAVSTTSPQ